MALRRRQGGAAPRTPNFFQVFPASTTSISVYYPKVNGATEYEVWRSTDGTNYSLYSTVPTSGIFNYMLVVLGGMTRQTQYWFKLRAKNAFGTSGFTSAYYTWPVDGYASNYATNALSGDATPYQNFEMLYVDMFTQEIEAAGIDMTYFDNIMVFSPFAGANYDDVGFAYDIIQGVSQTIVGGSISSAGLYSNYDGYIDIQYPYFGSAQATYDNFYGCVDVTGLVAPAFTGYANRHTLFGVTDGSAQFHLSHWTDTGTEYIGIINGGAGAEYALDTLSGFPITAKMGAGIGMDIHSGCLFVQKNSATTASDLLSYDLWPTGQTLHVGAYNDNGSVNKIIKGTIRGFYLVKGVSLETQRAAMMTAISNLNSNFGR